MHDSTCQQGRHCESCTRATRAAYIGIARAITGFVSRNPELPALAGVVVAFGCFAAKHW